MTCVVGAARTRPPPPRPFSAAIGEESGAGPCGRGTRSPGFAHVLAQERRGMARIVLG